MPNTTLVRIKYPQSTRFLVGKPVYSQWLAACTGMNKTTVCANTTIPTCINSVSNQHYAHMLPPVFPRQMTIEYICCSEFLPRIHRTYNNNNYLIYK